MIFRGMRFPILLSAGLFCAAVLMALPSLAQRGGARGVQICSREDAVPELALARKLGVALGMKVDFLL